MMLMVQMAMAKKMAMLTYSPANHQLAKGEIKRVASSLWRAGSGAFCTWHPVRGLELAEERETPRFSSVMIYDDR